MSKSLATYGYRKEASLTDSEAHLRGQRSEEGPSLLSQRGLSHGSGSTGRRQAPIPHTSTNNNFCCLKGPIRLLFGVKQGTGTSDIAFKHTIKPLQMGLFLSALEEMVAQIKPCLDDKDVAEGMGSAPVRHPELKSMKLART